MGQNVSISVGVSAEDQTAAITGGGPPPVETFRILMEDGSVLLAETGDALRKE